MKAISQNLIAYYAKPEHVISFKIISSISSGKLNSKESKYRFLTIQFDEIKSYTKVMLHDLHIFNETMKHRLDF